MPLPLRKSLLSWRRAPFIFEMMSVEKHTTAFMVEEIIHELKVTSLWRKDEPDWVKYYETNKGIFHGDFAEWLQFIYLPNCKQPRAVSAASIVPQAMKYFGNDIKRGRLLELFIALDALV